jgi:large subunit ribosomal protein L24
MNSLGIRKDDTVVVLSGKDKGKKGKVLATLPKDGKLLIEGVNMATKHKKPRRQNDPGGIIKQESPLYASKVMRVCPKCNQPTRIGHVIGADGVKSRRCKKCGEEI